MCEIKDLQEKGVSSADGEEPRERLSPTPSSSLSPQQRLLVHFHPGSSQGPHLQMPEKPPMACDERGRHDS